MNLSLAAIACINLGLWMALSGCSDDSPQPLSSGLDSAPSEDQRMCTEYCESLVQSAPGCEPYNDNRRCERICMFYMTSDCKTNYQGFIQCLGPSGKASCVLPDDGKLTLMVGGCHEQYEDWLACRKEKNVEFCPY